jgi:hypothetical protein
MSSDKNVLIAMRLDHCRRKPGTVLGLRCKFRFPLPSLLPRSQSLRTRSATARRPSPARG